MKEKTNTDKQTTVSSPLSKNASIMKQPELGLKISELRKSKGYTQEELVEKCNISVRTIQRIEAGEVTPRSYTIKTILSALDYNLKDIKSESNTITDEFKRFFHLEIDDSKEAGHLIQQLNFAWISGIIYFMLGFGEIAVDYARYENNEMVVSTVFYIVLKLLVLVSLVLFTRGFVLTGKLFNNYLLRITAFIFIFIGCVFYCYDILSLFTGTFEYQFVLGAQAITYGIIGLLFGIGILRLQKILGTIALVTGIFEIISYGFMITVLLAIVGLFFLTPTIILEIILLYKVSQMIKAKYKELTTP
ncbi:helix-turn-helix domain-containing protein [Aquimarina brevivitae]|nr:helix-turn-helix transcriptional regulator [Aquimarina brevivitae]